ncbi:MAG: hypothetical protein AB3N33_05855 [Puniceicoccaceae bacterium]
MKFARLRTRQSTAALVLAGVFCSELLMAIEPTSFIRPDYQNSTGPGEAGGVYFLDGVIAPEDKGPGSNGIYLSEAKWGHPLATVQSFGPSGDFVLRKPDQSGVYDILYPPGYRAEGVTLTRSQMEDPAQGGAFRYKWLLYNDAEGAALNTFEDAENSASWFTDDDRIAARAQIEVLRKALASAPLNQELQIALLNIYHDLAVAESQFARKQKAELATVRLGLSVRNNPFVIDDEIELYRELIDVFGTAVAWYMEFLSFSEEGVEPGDYIPAFTGAPFGYFIFATRVPARSQTQDDLTYTTDEGVLLVADPDPANGQIFAGYKDYRTLVSVHGQLMQAKTELARLLALRRNPGDETEARQLLTQVQGPDVNTFTLIKGIFPTVDFEDPALESSGVRQAYSLVDTALNASSRLRGFVNGTANILGLDPDFLILAPPSGDNFDTYDILSELLKKTDENGDPIGPLAVALEELGDPENPETGGGAIQTYANYRQTATQTALELDKLEDEFALRFVEVTGYDYNEGVNGWDGINPHPTNPSELADAERLINKLIDQNETLKLLQAELEQNLLDAAEAVTIAEGIDDSITSAEADYLGTTSSAWDDIAFFSATAAAADALTSGIYATAQSPEFGGITATAAVVNAGEQALASAVIANREKQIDNAAIAFETKLATAELPLTVQQSKLELGSVRREAHALLLEKRDNTAALGQAIADRTSLLREIERLEDYLNDDRALLANSYHADPIHYLRAENAILEADAAFRRAQRWLFYTVRALEYKYQERFSFEDTGSGEIYNLETIFKARNANELDDIYRNMQAFDQDRGTFASGDVDRATISMRDNILTPNPDDVNREFGAFPPDKGFRYDPKKRKMVTKQQRFRDILRDKQTTPSPGGGVNGRIAIDFSTLLEVGQFFKGPDYSDLNDIASGIYRDKVIQIAVHFMFEDGAMVRGSLVPTVPGNNGIGGTLSYSGNTFFRTRVPPAPDRSTGVSINPVARKVDFPGEFVVAPFRFYQDADFDGVFDVFDRRSVRKIFAFSSQSVEVPEVVDRIDAETGFQITTFKELSVAATRWRLVIDENQFIIDDLIDIQIIIDHQYYERALITVD